MLMKEIIELLSVSFLDAFKMILSSNVGINAKSGKNTLKSSELANTAVSNHTANKDGDIITQLIVDDYIQFIESGRRKGAKFPPVAPIVKWCKKNGIPTDNSTVFLIRRAISRDGIPARPIMNLVWNEMEHRMDSHFYEMIFEKITEEITKFFNK